MEEVDPFNDKIVEEYLELYNFYINSLYKNYENVNFILKWKYSLNKNNIENMILFLTYYYHNGKSYYDIVKYLQYHKIERNNIYKIIYLIQEFEKNIFKKI